MNRNRWKEVPGKILHRCDRCGQFHAAYVVDDPEVVRQVRGENSGETKVILCQTCWKALFGEAGVSRQASSFHSGQAAKVKRKKDN